MVTLQESSPEVVIAAAAAEKTVLVGGSSSSYSMILYVLYVMAQESSVVYSTGCSVTMPGETGVCCFLDALTKQSQLVYTILFTHSSCHPDFKLTPLVQTSLRLFCATISVL